MRIREKKSKIIPPFLVTVEEMEHSSMFFMSNPRGGIQVCSHEQLKSYWMDWMDDEKVEPEYEISPGGTAIIRFDGIVRPNTYWWSAAPGLDQMIPLVFKLADDDRVKRSVLHSTTPGGNPSRLDEFCQAVLYHKSKKPIIGFGQDICTSAGYWMFADLSSIWCDLQAMMAGLGTYTILRDSSAMWKEIGVEYKLVSSGGVKGLGADGRVTKELEQDRLRLVLADNAIFKEAVARRMGGSVDELFDGKVYIGNDALSLGLVDGVMDYKTFLDQLESGLLPEVTKNEGVEIDGSLTRRKTKGASKMGNKVESGENESVMVPMTLFNRLMSVFPGASQSKGNNDEPVAESTAATGSRQESRQSEVKVNEKQERLLSALKRTAALEIEKHVQASGIIEKLSSKAASKNGLGENAMKLLCFLSAQELVIKVNSRNRKDADEASKVSQSLADCLDIDSDLTAMDFSSCEDPYTTLCQIFDAVPNAAKVLGEYKMGQSSGDEIPKGGGGDETLASLMSGEAMPPWENLDAKRKAYYTAHMGRSAKKDEKPEDVARVAYERARTVFIQQRSR